MYLLHLLCLCPRRKKERDDGDCISLSVVMWFSYVRGRGALWGEGELGFLMCGERGSFVGGGGAWFSYVRGRGALWGEGELGFLMWGEGELCGGRESLFFLCRGVLDFLMCEEGRLDILVWFWGSGLWKLVTAVDAIFGSWFMEVDYSRWCYFRELVYGSWLQPLMLFLGAGLWKLITAVDAIFGSWFMEVDYSRWCYFRELVYESWLQPLMLFSGAGLWKLVTAVDAIFMLSSHLLDILVENTRV